MEELAKLFNHIDILVIGDTAGEFAQLTHLKDEVLLDLIKLSADKFESVKVPLLPIVLQVDHLILELVELGQNCAHFEEDGLLALRAVLEVSECLMLKEPINEESFNLFELRE